MRIVSLFALLIGCGSEPASPVQVPPPIGDLDLDINGVPSTSGSRITFIVTGATPGATVWVGRGNSTASPGLCAGVFNGACMEMSSPTLVMSGTADAQGEYRFTSRETARPRQQVTYYQAISDDGEASRLRGRFQDRSRLMIPGHTLSLERAPGQTQQITGSYTIDVGGVNQACRITADVVGGPVQSIQSCPQCNYSWELTLDNWRDVSTVGDCEDYMGLDAANVGSLNFGFGLTNSGFRTYGHGMAWSVPNYGYVTGRTMDSIEVDFTGSYTGYDDGSYYYGGGLTEYGLLPY